MIKAGSVGRKRVEAFVGNSMKISGGKGKAAGH
jgi:hypothetical protein